MMNTDGQAMRLLTVNPGFSSLKAALYHLGQEERLELAVQADRIGLSGSHVRIWDARGATLLDLQRDLPNHEAALQALFTWLRRHQRARDLDAVGHRVVHGGHRYSEPELMTAELVATLKQVLPLDPEHLPQALGAIEAVRRAYPSVPQVACFDTTFHRTMLPVAQMYALPRHLWDAGVRRFGFHGLSYESILHELRALDSTAAAGRVIIAHLGNGASMAAVRGGASLDTTMGLTPTGGLVMSTRPGDLDPGVLVYLLESQGMSAAAPNTLLMQHSGLLGISGTSADMRDLLDRESADGHAAEASALFYYQARKYLGALAAVLGGWAPWSSREGSASMPRRFASASVTAWTSWASRSTRSAMRSTRRSSRVRAAP